MTSSPGAFEQILWLNGRFVQASKAAVSPLDRGFLYGDGVFETMRAESGRVLFLQDHLERLERSLQALRIAFGRQPDWETLFKGLLERNNLSNDVAGVKIIATRGASAGPGLPECQAPTLCLMANRYTPPDERAYQEGWRIAIFDRGFSPPLAKHKSLNYLFFLAARQEALETDADEALIVDPYGKVTETSIGSLLARTEGKWWTPAASHQLPGITLRRTIEILAGKGEEAERRQASTEDIIAAETVWVLNSLMGIMPVREIAGHTMADPAAEAAAQLRRELFARGKDGDSLPDRNRAWPP